MAAFDGQGSGGDFYGVCLPTKSCPLSLISLPARVLRALRQICCSVLVFVDCGNESTAVEDSFICLV